MLRAVRLKFLFLFILTVVAIMFVLPSLTGGLPGWWEKHVSRGLKLGLDLKGGMHLILQVDMESAVRNALNRDANDLKEMAEKRGLTLKIGDVAKETLPVTLPNKDEQAALQKFLQEEFPHLAAGDYQARAFSPDGRGVAIAVSLAAGEDGLVTATLAPRVPVTVHVQDSTGAAVGGARVALYDGSGLRAVAIPNADGALVVTGIEPGAYDLVVFADGFAAEIIPGVSVAGAFEQTVTLEPSTTGIRGRLVGPDGQPVPQGAVEVFAIPIEAPWGTRRSLPGPIRTLLPSALKIPSPRTT